MPSFGIRGCTVIALLAIAVSAALAHIAVDSYSDSLHRRYILPTRNHKGFLRFDAILSGYPRFLSPKLCIISSKTRHLLGRDALYRVIEQSKS